MTDQPNPHEPSEACDRFHCYSCGVDHPESGWRRCYECGHLYHTPGELRRVYRAIAWRMLRHNLRRPHGKRATWLRSNGFQAPIAAQLWHILTIRVDRIPVCQQCCHDF